MGTACGMQGRERKCAHVYCFVKGSGGMLLEGLLEVCIWKYMVGYALVDLRSVPSSGHYMYRTLVTIRTVQWSLYVAHSCHYMYSTVVIICTARLTFRNTKFLPQGVFVFLACIWEQTAIISLYSIDWLVFITETECVYCAVRSTFYVLPTQCIYVFCVDLRTNSDYFTVRH